jgi:hypothetical protein
MPRVDKEKDGARKNVRRLLLFRSIGARLQYVTAL